MKLYYSSTSPYVRKVMVLLEEAGRTGEVELVNEAGTPTSPNVAVLAVNPIGKIPCLITEDCPAVYDSRVITRYLDALFGTGLYPDDDDIWPTLTLEAHADGMLDAAVLSVYEVRCRDAAMRSADWVAGQHKKIASGLDALESHWIDHLAGPIGMGHIGVGCALGYLDFRLGMGGWSQWRDGHPHLTKWGDAFLQRPSMAATAPE